MIPTWEEFNNGTQFTQTKGPEMAELKYDKEATSKIESKSVTPRIAGIWNFAITDAKMKTAKTGNEGINVTMEVDQDSTTLSAFDTFWLSENALFRLKNAADACGEKLPDEETDVIGWTGKAQFTVNDEGWFEVKRYIIESEVKSNFAGGEKSDW